ncbi:MAG: trimethylamine corrinoid protein 2 [Clostridiales bacterium]|nr:trimethylamine corrinoid protein 2 [Clostridiales bacterium]
MLYCKDWEKKKEKFMEFWNRENHDRPLLFITAPKDDMEPAPVSNHGTLKERWMDTEFVLEMANWRMQNTAYFGEAFPALNPDLGPDFFAACYGTELNFGENTSWSIPWMSDGDVEVCKGFQVNQENEYYKKMLEITKAAVEDGKGKYLVGITDLHPGGDGLVSMRGPQNLCYDTLDYPEFIKEGVMHLLPGFQKIYDELYELTTKYQEGSTCWMGLWYPGKWYPVSCDFSCMVSKDMYEELLAEEIEKETEWLDASMYHLDGPDALKHLDRILQMPHLNGVQWVYGAGNPTASHWIPEIKKIQAAGKCVQINVVPEELETMLKELPPEGLMYMIEAESERQARELMELVQKWSKR